MTKAKEVLALYCRHYNGDAPSAISRARCAALLKVLAEDCITLPPARDSDGCCTVAYRNSQIASRNRILALALEIDPGCLTPISSQWTREKGWVHRYF